MSFLSSRPVMRWLVPVAAAAAVIGGGAAVGTLAANADPVLPDRTAAQLLVDLQNARVDGLSGTVVQRADLGLPAIANLARTVGGDDSLASLISGKNTLRVWYAGPDQARVALIGSRGQSDVIRNGSDVWFWNSRTKEATHAKISVESGHGVPASPPAGIPATPQEAADFALRAIDPTTEVTVGRSARIAGRDAYELVLAPRDKASLVGQVRVAIDAAEYVPLRVQVFPKDSVDAAFEAAFTRVTFDRPDPAQFEFNPPPGTAVNEANDAQAGGSRVEEPRAIPDKPATGTGGDNEPRTVGTGWTTVVVASVGEGVGEATKAPQGEGAEAVAGLLGQLPKVSGAWGSGQLLSGRLFTVLLTDDGRVLGGLVAPERLYEVAAQR